MTGGEPTSKPLAADFGPDCRPPAQHIAGSPGWIAHPDLSRPPPSTVGTSRDFACRPLNFLTERRKRLRLPSTRGGGLAGAPNGTNTIVKSASRATALGRHRSTSQSSTVERRQLSWQSIVKGTGVGSRRVPMKFQWPTIFKIAGLLFNLLSAFLPAARFRGQGSAGRWAGNAGHLVPQPGGDSRAKPASRFT